jgi:hypothetical protein
MSDQKLFAILLSVHVPESTTRAGIVEMLTESAKAKELFRQLGLTVLFANAQELSTEEFPQ